MTGLTTNYVMLFSLTTSIVVIMISSWAFPRPARPAPFNARCLGFIASHWALEAIESENG